MPLICLTSQIKLRNPENEVKKINVKWGWNILDLKGEATYWTYSYFTFDLNPADSKQVNFGHVRYKKNGDTIVIPMRVIWKSIPSVKKQNRYLPTKKTVNALLSLLKKDPQKALNKFALKLCVMRKLGS